MLDARRRACLRAIGVDLWELRGDRPGSDAGGADAPVHTDLERDEGRGTRAEEGLAPTYPAGAEVERAAGLGPGAGHAGGDTVTAAPAVASEVTLDASDALPVATAADSEAAPSPDLGSPADWAVNEADAGEYDAYASFAAEPEPPLLDPVAELDWPALQSTVAGCTACTLHETRTQTVFGVGDQQASLMVIGEAPGADEDRQGEPFVGRAGQLLNAMLEAIGLAREQVYIANIVKCRPPGNRDPHAEEAAACRPYLMRQIELIRPKLILAVGRVSTHNLLDTDQSLARLRGKTHRFGPQEIPLRVTYHPAYLLRRPLEKAKAWQDLQAAYRLLKEAAASE